MQVLLWTTFVVLLFCGVAECQNKTRIRMGMSAISGDPFVLSTLLQMADLPDYDIQLFTTPQGLIAAQMMDRGEMEIFHASSFTTGSSWARGIDLQILTAVSPTDDQFQVFVKNNPAINSPADLQGRTLAVIGNSILHYLAVEFINAFSLTNVTLWTNMTTATLSKTWQAVDAVVFPTSTLSFFTANGGRTFLSSSVFGLWRKGYANTLSVRRDFGLQHTKAVSTILHYLVLLDNAMMNIAAGVVDESPRTLR
eukprot:TRINITY_DN6087_c0_g6_i1.p1 TRINITY_DN6087_c0_g6~~TRINITY_DN6087_c0_g6_i1.p1  ORF type:complete len:253 (+),score=55.46 TRINITY_DN6087_c0_g6_i1:298-1056(+)